MSADWRTPLAAVVALVLGLALLPGAADARPQDGDLMGSGHRMPTHSQPEHWYGAKKLGEVTAYCIDLNSGPPREASGWTEYTNYTLFRQIGWGGPRGEHGNGTRKTLVAELAELSWILHETGSSPGPDVGAAVEHTVRLRTMDGVEQQRKEEERWSAVTRAHPGVTSEFNRLQRDAAAFAGPYTLDVTWLRRPSSTDPSGELGIRVLSASGNPVPDRPVSVRGTADLTILSQSGSTGPDGTANAIVQLPAPDVEQVSGSVTVEVSDLPGPRPRLFVPTEETIQRMIAAPDPVSLSWRDEALLEPVPWRPVVSTQTRDVVATAGASAVDIVTVTGGRPGAGFTGSSTLFGPFASLQDLAAGSPEDAPKVGVAQFTGTYDEEGSAEVHTTALEFPGPGYYMWREQLDASHLVLPPSAPEWPQASETSVVVSPLITSELVLSGEPLAGATVTDTLHLDGVPESRAVPGSDEPLTVHASGELLGPVPPVEVDGVLGCDTVRWRQAPVLARYEDLELSASVLDQLLHTTLEEPGCYTASAHIQVRHEGRVVAEVAHAPGLPSQSVHLLAPPTPTPPPSTPPPPQAAPPPPTPTTPPATPPAEPTPPVAEAPPTTPAPPTVTPTPPAPTPPQQSPPPEPDTPRINSGTPIHEVRWHLVHVGLLMSFMAVGTRLRSTGRRP